jgi:hypothetical protein
MGRLIVIVLAMAIAIRVTYAQTNSLREEAKSHDVNVVVNNEYSPTRVEQIASEADAVALVRIDLGKTLLGDHDTRVFTDYQVTVERVLKSRRSPEITAGTAITVRRWGGAMALEGHNVVAQETDFPPFNIGQRYILFLTAAPPDPFYYVAYGPQGAFLISESDDTVSQVSHAFGSWNRERGRLRTADFLTRLQSMIAGRTQ